MVATMEGEGSMCLCAVPAVLSVFSEWPEDMHIPGEWIHAGNVLLAELQLVLNKHFVWYYQASAFVKYKIHIEKSF